MKKIELFTTNVVEGREIEEYLGIITANQVSGTGFFTDFAAGLSDFFGGTSGAYRKSMNALYDDVVSQITDEVLKRGGNGVIGVSIDYDNISGKGMSMFMVSMQGTVVRFKKRDNQEQKISNGDVSLGALEKVIYLKKIRNLIDQDVIIGKDEWRFIVENNITELVPGLYKLYCKKPGYGDDLGLKNNYDRAFEEYLSIMDYKQAIELVYNNDEGILVNLINNYNLFNAGKILELCKSGRLKEALKVVGAKKASYSNNDLEEMIELSDYLHNLPDVGKIEEFSGLLGGKSRKFVCACGKKNDEGVEYCQTCEKNIKGLLKEQVEAIEILDNNISVLKEIFGQNEGMSD